MRDQLIYSVQRNFKDIYRTRPASLVVSPGRVNLIGDHTDYHLGYVFPAAIDLAIYIAISPADSEKCTIYSLEKRQTIEFTMESKPEKGHWINYILGVVQKLWKKYPEKVKGIKAAMSGEIPQGAGLSSSAAITCGFAVAIDKIFELGMERRDLAKIAQEVEHEYVNVKCGLMDQYACLFGKEHHGFLLDCEAYDLQHMRIEDGEYSWILIDSMVQHELADSAYNDRRNESQAALDYLRSKNADIRTYKDVNRDLLLAYKEKLDPVLFRRASHVVAENLRVQKVFFALSQNDLETVGEQLDLSHRSLKESYEVTCHETDYIAETMSLMPGVLGARQMGGGFGGCIISLVDNAYLSEITDRIQEAYAAKFSQAARLIKVKFSDGCRILSP